ncbi:hypothetical protein TNCV_2892051 [Trichonephila clavipes]|nr:hypothetical protein TNCV_2892051 [Trichonephila clavipes]
MEIRTSSSDNNSSNYKSNNFEGMQSRSNESQYSRKNWSGKRRELEGKGTGLLRRVKVGPRLQGAKRNLTSSPDHPVRREHKKEDQLDREEAGRNNSTDPTPRCKEDQAAGIPEAEVVSNSFTRRRKGERTATDPSS